MISEGSRDTEDWSNDCPKIQHFILEINYILKYIQIENIFNLQYMSQYCGFYCIFKQIL